MVLLYTAVEEGYAPWLFRAQTNSLEALFVCHDCSYKILLSLALNYCLTPGNTVMYNSFNEINNFAIRLFILLQTPEKMKQLICCYPLIRYLFIMIYFLSIVYGVLKQTNLFHSGGICIFEALLIIQTLINVKPDRSRMYVLKFLWWSF